jgi:ABC-2 type transport system permease protein
VNTQSNALSDSPRDSQGSSATAMAAPRPMYWSVRRELWENRSIYIAPLAAAGVYVFGYLISLICMPRRMRAMAAGGSEDPLAMLAMPYSHAAMFILLTGFIVGVFYSLDALYGERRDRSILFWKSLPVSDLTTVLSKASIPLVVLPLFIFTVTVATEFIALLLSIAGQVRIAGGASAPSLASLLFQMQVVLLYSLIVLTLWHAPIYGWLLLVSSWARRTTFLWAVLPLLVLGVFERIAFHTTYFGSLLKDRLIGFAAAAFALKTPGGEAIDPHFIPLAQLAPGKFLSTPGLWIGLAVAAAFLAAAVRLRRYREPI